MIALDLFCGAGGAALGLQAAGFEVVGVDIEIPSAYPGQFIQADVRNLPMDVRDFDFIWASPPCQEHSCARNGYTTPTRYECLIPETRTILKEHPYTCIENVPGAPIRPDVILTGPPCGLPYIRWKRWFGVSWFCLYPYPAIPSRWLSRAGLLITPTRGGASTHNMEMRRAAGFHSVPRRDEKKAAKGIPIEVQMTNDETGEAVPPPYAHLIAAQAAEHIRKAVAQ